jgi:hypothetical protein
MKVSQNIGIINALIRITCGLTILTWVTAKLVRRPWRDSYLIIAMLAAMKVGEGILRYCPVTDLLDNNSNGDGKKSSSDEKGSSSISGLAGMLNLKNALNNTSNKEDNKGSNKENNKGSNKESKENHASDKQQDFNPEEFTNAEVQAALSGKTDQNQNQDSSKL